MIQPGSLYPRSELPVASGGRSVLVAFASRAGSTREIAERIAAVLGDQGHRVDLRSVGQVGDVSTYDAVVIGSPVYDGSWLPDASELLRRNLDRLGSLPVWLFSVGTFGDEHRIVGRLMKKEPREMAHFLQAVRPRDYRVFAGVIDRASWPLYGKLFLRMFGGRLGDNRDWNSIERWATHIAAALAVPAPAQSAAR